MKLTRCDRCYMAILNNQIFQATYTNDLYDSDEIKTFDLCSSCHHQLKKFFEPIANPTK